MSIDDKYCKKCKSVVGMTHTVVDPDYIQGAVDAVTQLYLRGFTLSTLRISEPYNAERDVLGLCMRALGGHANPRQVKNLIDAVFERELKQ